MERIGYCRLCGLKKTLTHDHVPPKSCFNSGLIKTTRLSDDNYFLLSQNGLKLQSVCRECNNDYLGGKFDLDFSVFVKDIAKYYYHNKFAKLKLMRFAFKANSRNIARSIIGHLLAANFTKENIVEPLPEKHSDFVDNLYKCFWIGDDEYFNKIRIYFWIHQYRTIEINPFFTFALLGSEDSTIFGALLKFFPLGIYVVEKEKIDKYLKVDLSEIIVSTDNIIVDYNNVQESNFPLSEINKDNNKWLVAFVDSGKNIKGIKSEFYNKTHIIKPF